MSGHSARRRLTARSLATAMTMSAVFGLSSGALADEKPQYGGTLQVATVNRALNVLTWDPADWNWKINHDTGQF